MWYLAQLTIIIAVIFSNIRWGWAGDSASLAACVAVGAAYGLTSLVGRCRSVRLSRHREQDEACSQSLSLRRPPWRPGDLPQHPMRTRIGKDAR
jgi:hypothetical protein